MSNSVVNAISTLVCKRGLLGVPDVYWYSGNGKLYEAPLMEPIYNENLNQLRGIKLACFVTYTHKTRRTFSGMIHFTPTYRAGSVREGKLEVETTIKGMQTQFLVANDGSGWRIDLMSKTPYLDQESDEQAKLFPHGLHVLVYEFMKHM